MSTKITTNKISSKAEVTWEVNFFKEHINSLLLRGSCIRGFN